MGLVMNQDVIVLDEASVIMNPDCARVSPGFMVTDANIKPRYGKHLPHGSFSLSFLLYLFCFSLVVGSSHRSLYKQNLSL